MTPKPFRLQTNKHCVDIPGGINKDNLQAIIYPCHKGPNQKFIYNRHNKTLKNLATKKCLASHKGKIVQKKCSKTSKKQKFERKGKQWINSNSKKCLDVEGGNYASGKLIEFSCHSGLNQKFNHT
jgi:hypothetical protein